MGQRGSVGTQRPLTEFEQAHLIAQQNAALPVSQGGLGLAPDNTAMDRARALGFDVDNPMYHGTNQDINAFINNAPSQGHTLGAGLSNASYFTPDPKTASGWATSTKPRDDDFVNLMISASFDKKASKELKKQSKDFLKNYESFKNGKTVYPVLVNKGQSAIFDAKGKTFNELPLSQIPDNLVNKAIKNKKDSLIINNLVDPPVQGWGGRWDYPQLAIFDPKNIRSRFAAFDPMKKESSNLLATSAAIAPTATMAAYLYNQERNKGGKQ